MYIIYNILRYFHFQMFNICSEVVAQGWLVKRYIFKNIFFTEHLRATAFFIKLKKLIIDQILFWWKID